MGRPAVNLERLGPKALWFIKSAWSFKFETYQYIINSYRIDPLNLHIWTIFGLMIRKYFSDGLKPPIRVCLKWHFCLTGKVMINQRNVVPCFQKPIIICYVYIRNIRTKYEDMIIYIQSTDVLQASVCFSITQTIWSWWVQKERRRQMRPNALFMDESIYRSRGLAGSNMQHVTQKTSQSLIQNINGSLPFSCLRAAAVRERTGLGTRWKITAFLGIAMFQASCSFFRLRKSWKSHDFLHPSSFQMQNPLVSTKYQSKWSINPHNTPN